MMVCVECGVRRSRRLPRRPVLVEIEADGGGRPVADAGIRTVAARLLGRAGDLPEVRVRGLPGGLGGPGIGASMLEEQLDTLLHAGWIGLVWEVSGTRRRLRSVRLRDPDALDECARPGRRAARRAALAEARAAVAPLRHPVATEVGRLLDETVRDAWSPGLVRALAAVARHAETGDVLASRVFAARYLGDSKALGGLRPRLERLLGPLDTLGIRDGASATFVGGSGCVHAAGVRVDLASLRPFVGLAAESVAANLEIEAPPGGLVVVENFAVFEACCRGEVSDLGDTLVIWTAGYPGRAVKAVIYAASRTNAGVRIWADLDLDGVRIVRLVAEWLSGTVEPYGMSPGHVAAAPARRALSPRSAAAIRADLASRPAALLADTLRALLANDCWVEQEAFLGARSGGPGPGPSPGESVRNR
jgi:Wadjet anti plasmid transformation system JetA-like protein